jgi:putative zinc finger protein
MTDEPESMRLADAHARDLLPEYLAGALDSATRQAVRTHLLTCASCAAELRAWEQIGAVEREHVVETSAPALALLGEVWRRIDAEPAAQPAESRSRLTAFLWNVVTAQARLLRRSVWVASALGIALASVLAASLSAELGRDGVLTIALPLIAAAGVAFLYGPENDPGLEITLATPTPARLVLLSRFALLFAFDVALALIGTLAISLARGESLWGLALAWLGPMTLLATISLALSLFTGPVVAALGAAVAWLASALRFDSGLTLRFPPEALARMTPGILALSVGALLLAVIAVSRREQFAPVDN